jgi:hypothetical protein
MRTAPHRSGDEPATDGVEVNPADPVRLLGLFSTCVGFAPAFICSSPIGVRMRNL